MTGFALKCSSTLLCVCLLLFPIISVQNTGIDAPSDIDAVLGLSENYFSRPEVNSYIIIIILNNFLA